jgi:hypothetical protein
MDACEVPVRANKPKVEVLEMATSNAKESSNGDMHPTTTQAAKLSPSHLLKQKICSIKPLE